MSYFTVTVTVTITRSYNTEKVIGGFRTDDVI